MQNAEEKSALKATHKRMLMAILVTVLITGASWYGIRIVSSEKQGALIRTQAEAVIAAESLLAREQPVYAHKYNLLQEPTVKPDKLKGRNIWRISWVTKPDVVVPNIELVLLVFEDGNILCDEITNAVSLRNSKKSIP